MNLSTAKFFVAEKMDGASFRTAGCTAFALAAFAANSILCRLALGDGSIDAASFSAIRLASGALALMLTVGITRKSTGSKGRGSWTSAGMLFLYAVTFSFAYTDLTAGTGALILFGAVQATMILAGLRQGERFGWLEWCGLSTALAGLIFLVLPGLAAPPLTGAVLMATAGIRSEPTVRVSANIFDWNSR